MTLETGLSAKLAAQQKEGRYRSLVYGDPNLIDFTSNDYLGLARSVELKNAIDQSLLDGGFPMNGSTGSRLLSGNTRQTDEIENELAFIFQAEASLIFNSGYTANLAVLSSIPQRNDTIVYDEYAHASIKDGARLSLARRLSFRHNDLDDLEAKIRKSAGHVFVVVESVYSMDGDEAPLVELCSLAAKHGATVVLDEAHSTGVMGPRGAGMAVSQGLANQVGIRIHTFGKAMGVHGACVTGSRNLKEFLVNFARPFIYTTAPDMHSLVSIIESFRFLGKHVALQAALHERISTFRREMAGSTQVIPASCAIHGFILSGNDHARHVAQALQLKGFDVRPILSPTVPVGLERIRICLHTFNTRDEIVSLTQALKSMTKSAVPALA